MPNEPNSRSAGDDSLQRHRDHRDSLSEFRSELSHVLLRALCVSVVGILVKRTQFESGQDERQVSYGKGVMVDSAWKRRWKTKPIPRRPLRVPRPIGFVSQNRPCRRMPAAPASLAARPFMRPGGKARLRLRGSFRLQKEWPDAQRRSAPGGGRPADPTAGRNGPTQP